MAFHNVRFPVTISYGSGGGPGYNTHIVVTDSGAEERVARWAFGRHTYEVQLNNRTRAQLAEVRRFFHARRGATHSFRFKDHHDFTTATDMVSSASHTDQQIGVGDGTRTVFQLFKTYADGAASRTRTITKPVAGSVLVGVAGSNVATGWSLNYLTGELEFDVAPSLGQIVSWGGEFDVPCRFGKETDSLLNMAIEGFNSGSSQTIQIIEDIEDNLLSDEFYYGGASIKTTGSNQQLNVLDGRAQSFNFTASGKHLTLPDFTSMPRGGPYFCLYNAGSNAFDLKNHTGSTVVTMSAGSVVTIWLGVDTSGNPIWIVA